MVKKQNKDFKQQLKGDIDNKKYSQEQAQKQNKSISHPKDENKHLYQKLRIYWKKTYKEVKQKLISKFGFEKIDQHKQWIIPTLNKQKLQNKIIPSNQQNSQETDQQQQDNENEETYYQEQSVSNSEDNQSFQSIKSPKKQEVRFEFESLNSEQLKTESEESEQDQDSPFPELQQIDDLISSKFTALTQIALKQMQDKLLNIIINKINNELLTELKEELENSNQTIFKLSNQIQNLNIPEIQDLISNGKLEIEEQFDQIKQDIKQKGPLLGIATQESLANQVRLFTDKISQINDKINEHQINIKKIEDKSGQFSEEITKQISQKSQQLQELDKRYKNIIDQVNQIVSTNRKTNNEQLENLNQKINLINNQIIEINQNLQQNIKSLYQNEKTSSTSQQQQKCNQQNSETQYQQLNTKNEFNLIMARYNQGCSDVKIYRIQGQVYIHDTLYHKFIQIEEQNSF